MRIKHLLLMLLALPMAFVACEKTPAVDEVKNPTVAITVGEATETSIAFTITSTEADEVKYIVVESTEGTPTATEVLANGTVAEANTEAGCYVEELKDNTEYTIVAAAKNTKAVVKAEAKMTTKTKGGEEPTPPTPPADEFDVEFTAQDIHIEYYGDEFSAAYNYYLVLSDVGVILTENEMKFKDNGIYYLLDLYAADSAENNNFTVPNGTYKAATSSAAGTFGLGDYGAGLNIVEGEPTYYLYADGEVVVSDGKIEAVITMEDGAKHKITFEGSLYFGDNGNEPEPPTPGDEFSATHTATKWLWGGASSYGNAYQVVGDNFSVDVHFPAQFAQENALTAGDYIWTSTTWFGYNDFENEFTTRSFVVDGTSVAVDGGSAKVEASGDEYHIELTLEGRDGFKYMIEYNGKLNEKEEVETGNIVITLLSEGEYNSSYGFYTFKAANDNVTFDLLINDYQAQATTIYADDFMYAPMKSLTGSLGYFFIDNFKLDGVKYKPQVNSTMKVTGDGTNVDITLNLFMDSGDEMVVVYTGTVGGNGGGTTPSEPAKLATPSVSGIVSGNAATISWQEIAGAKDYTVTLNGSLVSTVTETYIVYTDLEYGVAYSVSVVANPADSAVNSASDAGTATFTTEADPNAGGDEGGNTGGDEWVGREVKLQLLAYQDNVLYTNVNNEGKYFMTAFRNGIVAGKFVIAGDNKSEEIMTSGHATSQYGLFGGTTPFADGDTVEVIDNGGGSYTIIYRVTVNDEKLTATYTGGLQ
ncbi:MAG: hypothetical protein J6U69_00260 [Alistipes sp.]|nr:hypothetical protein [Alistipes sp.]